MGAHPVVHTIRGMGTGGEIFRRKCFGSAGKLVAGCRLHQFDGRRYATVEACKERPTGCGFEGPRTHHAVPGFSRTLSGTDLQHCAPVRPLQGHAFEDDHQFTPGGWAGSGACSNQPLVLDSPAYRRDGASRKPAWQKVEPTTWSKVGPPRGPPKKGRRRGKS
jgi:hypothetical protein